MLLPWLILIPIFGGLLCWVYERFKPNTDVPRWIALFSMISLLLLSIWVWLHGDYHLSLPIGDAPTWAAQYRVNWIPRFGIDFHLAIDGLSLIMVMLNAFLGLLAVLCSWKEITHRVGFFHLNLMWIIAGVMGVFLAVDLFLFFVFWEAMLVPMYFLIALWGHSESGSGSRISAATKFFLYTQASGLLMLVSILGLVFAHYSYTGTFTFDYSVLRSTPLTGPLAYVLMLGFFIAFAVKLPVVPLHGWLPDAHAQAPTAGSVDLAGILLKTAAYGLLRYTLPLFPEASQQFAPIAMALGLVTVYYGAIVALAQRDLKRLVAWSGVSHMGFALIGIYAGTLLALQGVMVQMVAHALSAAGLFILSGQIYERLKTRDLRKMGGLFGRMGSLGGFSLVFILATLGMPGTGNFVAEFMILFGTFGAYPWVVVIACGGLLMGTVYSLVLMHRVFWGPAHPDVQFGGMDKREYLIMLALAASIILIGVYPHAVLDISQGSMGEVHHWFTTAISPH